MKISQSTLSKNFSQIKLLSLDVDGVLTDGGIYYTDKGDTFRKFDAKDGMGITLLLNAGIDVAIISAGAPGAIEHRAKRLNIKYVYTNIRSKLDVLISLCKDLKINLSQVAHIGDDINDIEVFKNVGISISVKDAVTEISSIASIVTSHVGGKGAVREICDAIILSNKK